MKAFNRPAMDRNPQMFCRGSVFTFISPSKPHWDDDEGKKKDDDNCWDQERYFSFSWGRHKSLDCVLLRSPITYCELHPTITPYFAPDLLHQICFSLHRHCEMFAPKGWNPEIIVHLFETICATSRERRSCLRYPLPTQGETNILSNPPPAPTQMYTHPDGNPTPLPLSAHTRNPHKQELGASEGGIGLLWNVTKSTQWMGEAALYLLNTAQEAGIVTKCTKKQSNTWILLSQNQANDVLGVTHLCVLTHFSFVVFF